MRANEFWLHQWPYNVKVLVSCVDRRSGPNGPGIDSVPAHAGQKLITGRMQVLRWLKWLASIADSRLPPSIMCLRWSHAPLSRIFNLGTVIRL